MHPGTDVHNMRKSLRVYCTRNRKDLQVFLRNLKDLQGPVRIRKDLQGNVKELQGCVQKCMDLL